MKKYNNYCGNFNVTMFYFNEWSDPQLLYKGITFNEPMISGDLYNLMLEEGYLDTSAQLAAYINNNIENYLDEIIASASQEYGIF